jgi:hypothetical protein
MPEVEVFTPTGVLAGSAEGVPLSNDGPDLLTPLQITESRWYPIDGSAPAHGGSANVSPDDILVIVTAPEDITVHMTWHTLVLDVGPYRVTGEFATHPGFDPEKSIARPSGPFVPLREVTIELMGDEAAIARRRHVHVNRYAVDQVTSSLVLAHFFPGARLVEPETAPVL